MSELSSNIKAVEKIDRDSYRVTFDTRIYSALAIKKAAYKFAAHFASLITTTSEHELTVELKFLRQQNEADQNELVQAFLNEVLDQDLREQIARETESTRNLILAEAFSKTSLLHEES